MAHPGGGSSGREGLGAGTWCWSGELRGGRARAVHLERRKTGPRVEDVDEEVSVCTIIAIIEEGNQSDTAGGGVT